VNFDPWPKGVHEMKLEEQLRPELRSIRFGWLDHTDWLPQAAATGQQSALSAGVENNQLLRYFP
jgi:hypothetical protein